MRGPHRPFPVLLSEIGGLQLSLCPQRHSSLGRRGVKAFTLDIFHDHIIWYEIQCQTLLQN